MRDYKIDFEGYSDDIKEQVQEICFGLGKGCRVSGEVIKPLSGRFLFVHQKLLGYTGSEVYFKQHQNVLISPEDFITQFEVAESCPRKKKPPPLKEANYKLDLSDLSEATRQTFSREIQETCFKHGVTWFDGTLGILEYLDKLYMFIEDGSIKHSNGTVFFSGYEAKLIGPVRFLQLYGDTEEKNQEAIDANTQVEEIVEVLQECNETLDKMKQLEDERPLSKREQDYLDRQSVVEPTKKIPAPHYFEDNDFTHRFGYVDRSE